MDKRSSFKVDWVLIDELAIGPAPRKIRHLEQLIEEGVKSILSLCKEEEVKSPREIGKMFKHKRVILPDHKYGRFPTCQELQNCLINLEELKSYGPVFVHCVASVERSPLVCLGWLIQKKGLDTTEAIEYLMQVHPKTNPLPGQIQLLNEFKSQ